MKCLNNNKKEVSLEPDTESHGIQYLKPKSQWVGYTLSIFLKMCVIWGKSERGYLSIFQHHLHWPLKAAIYGWLFFMCLTFILDHFFPSISRIFQFIRVWNPIWALLGSLPQIAELFFSFPPCFLFFPLCVHIFSIEEWRVSRRKATEMCPYCIFVFTSPVQLNALKVKN